MKAEVPSHQTRQQRFQEIRQRATEDSLSESISETPFLDLSEAERSELFHFAHQTWLDVFDRQAFAAAIEKSEAGQTILKEERKQGLILMSAYSAFDTRQKSPKPHTRFMRKIGKLNDGLPEEMHSYYRNQAGDALSLYEPVRDLDYIPETDEHYQASMSRKIEALQELFSNSRLPVDEFHEGRKSLRFIMGVLQIKAAMVADSNTYAVFKDWFITSRILEDIHDEVIATSQGDQLIYSSSQVELPEEVRDVTLRQLASVC